MMEGLKPEEVINEVKGRGYNISRKTLYNYEKEKLIPPPLYRNGNYTIYPKSTPEDVIKAWETVRYIQNNRYKLAREVFGVCCDKAKE